MPRELMKDKKERALKIAERMNEHYPAAECALHYWGDPFKLTIAVLLSAQTTDKGVNKVTPALWERYPTPEALAQAEIADVESIIRTIGFYHAKAANCIKCARMVVTEFGGEIPRDMQLMQKLPGVGRKTANLILGDVYGQAGYVCDTHCIRITGLLGLTDGSKAPLKVEQQLRACIPPEESSNFCHRMVLHGRAVCVARRPDCAGCTLRDLCDYGKTVREP